MHLRPVPIDDPNAPTGVAPMNGVTTPRGLGAAGRNLTDVLVELGFAGRDRVDEAMTSARSTGSTAEAVLLERGELTSDQLARAIAERHGVDHLDLTIFQADMAAANLISTGSARRYLALPVAFVDERTLLVAMADPANVRAIDDLAIMTGYEIRPAVASRGDIESVVGRLTQLDDAVFDAAVEQDGTDETGTPAAEIVDL